MNVSAGVPGASALIESTTDHCVLAWVGTVSGSIGADPQGWSGNRGWCSRLLIQTIKGTILLSMTWGEAQLTGHALASTNTVLDINEVLISDQGNAAPADFCCWKTAS